MALQTKVIPYVLDFKFPAGTSRGTLREKKTFILQIWEDSSPEIIGYGECGPLNKLSIDDMEDIEERLGKALKTLSGQNLPTSINEVYDLAKTTAGYSLPALRFGLETALLDLINRGSKLIFSNDFYQKQTPIPINGLIWMGHMEAMLLQISDKVNEGFDCIKMKVGSLDFEKEIDILNFIRRKYYNLDLMLRVDANGAFKPEDAHYKMETMAKHHIHSIEQPIAAGQTDLMAQLCERPPIDIALDEELIGVNTLDEKRKLLEKIKPQHIILKPTLLGGFQSCLEWIALADELKIGWWLTSALESNIGLNAICQFAAEVNAKGYQGLGTGKLYHNNIESPLKIAKGHIMYDKSKSWDISKIVEAYDE